ncbi:proline-rich transmembrane protein 1-like [Liolophura sinensis]|uniref:proline-rich transmembrane protein 1-like n=1 Tax=Liolophura sinensis TaxID=3198878 RepID=UPI0031584F6C
MSVYPQSPPAYGKDGYDNYGGQQYGQPGGPQYGQPGGPQYGQPGGPQYAQPGGPQYGQPYVQPPAQFNSNTTVVTTQPNVLIVPPSAPPPNNHMALAIVSCLLCVWPLGLVAIICSSQSADSARAGNNEDAATKGKISLGFSITSIVLGSLTYIILLVVYVTVGFGYSYYYG